MYFNASESATKKSQINQTQYQHYLQGNKQAQNNIIYRR